MYKINILIIDDETGIRNELKDFFTLYDYNIFLSDSPSSAFNILNENEIDIVILDIQLPEMNGIEVLKKIKNLYPDIEVIMITGHGDQNSIIQSLRYGAFDFFMKPFRSMELKSAIERTEKYINLNKKLKQMKNSFSIVSKALEKEIGTIIVGKSKKMGKVLKLVEKVADYENTNIMITGESGTGKELIARSIHLLSPRKKLPFYAVNCSAIPENLFETEFFGHKKGAFTGAISDKIGWFELANHGTLFLDEIGDLPLSQQTKFLRVLEEKKIRKIGSHKEISIDVRIITATNKNLTELVENNKFRLDLYHRLNSFTIHIPPLRERKEDIPALLEHFIKLFSEKLKKNITHIDRDVYDALYDYDFKGNVRELKNMVERAIILSEDNKLTLKNFPIFANIKKKSKLSIENEIINEIYDLKEIEKKVIIKALKKSNFNKSKAAKLLNISWYALNRKLKKYNIEF